MTTTAVHRRPDGTGLLVISGDLDVATCDDAYTRGAELMAAGSSTLYVDMMDVTFIDSTGIGCLIKLSNQATACDSTVVLLDPSPRVNRMLDLTGLSRVFQVKMTPNAGTPDLQLARKH